MSPTLLGAAKKPRPVVRVRRRNRNGVPGATVTMADGTKTWMRLGAEGQR